MRQARLHPHDLTFFVALVAVLADLVGLGGAGIDDLELGEHEHDRAVVHERVASRRLVQELVHAHGEVSDEIHHPVAGPRKLIDHRRTLVGRHCRQIEQLGQVMPQAWFALYKTVQVHDVVERFPRNHVVERHQPLYQLAQDENDFLFGMGDHAETQLVVDVRRDVVAFGEQLGDEAVRLLATPLELHDVAARTLHFLDGAQDLVFDRAEDLITAHREAVDQLAARQVLQHMHDLEHHTRVGAPLSILGGHQEEVTRRNPFRDFLSDVESQMPLEVFHRLFAQRFKPSHVRTALRVELMHAQEAINLVAVRKIQTVPVDDRAAANQVPDGCQIGDAEKSHTPVVRSIFAFRATLSRGFKSV